MSARRGLGRSWLLLASVQYSQIVHYGELKIAFSATELLVLNLIEFDRENLEIHLITE